MAQQKTRAPKLDSDTDSRNLIAFMRMAGIPSKDIAVMTGRNKGTIDREVLRPEHKNLLHDYLEATSKHIKLPAEDWEIIKNYLKERHKLE